MIRIMILILLFVFEGLFAQDFQGIVTYKTNRKMDLNMEDSKMNADMQKQLQEMLKKQFQKEYRLSFNATESVYREEENLGTPQPASGVQIVVAGSGASNILYKNIKEKRFARKQDMMGKLFLVKDNLEKLDWKLEDETKKIGNYTCYKATAKRMGQRIQNMRISTNDDNDEVTEPEEEEITITAWYTPEIPVSNGPGNYWGLPGLILEINDGDQSILCAKIVLNPKKKVNISEPTKGKEVTEEKFEQIVEKKMKEMRDRESRRGDGESIRIRIGG
ncbi:GLPGLI family protein [Aquimarina macrocephali]|uniref:GLPGLI family protein n=1 Tax=Aquimarina macrocephali TaxID=666563 RepID=UPI0004B4CC04|nr:GLPGLI family protein [Aquimarina macrocephali]